METLTIERANAMPAPTWHRLRMNDVDIELPAGLTHARCVETLAPPSLIGKANAFERVVERAQAALDERTPASETAPRAIVAAACGTTDPADLDVPALTPFQQIAAERELEGSMVETFETGMGHQAREYLEFAAGEPIVLATSPGETARASIRIEGVDGAVNAAAIDLVAAPNSSLALTVTMDSPHAGEGAVGTRIRAFVGENARIDLACTQTLDDSWTALDDTGIVLDRNARMTVRHVVLGAGRSYTGLAADLRGDDARLDADTRYLGHAQEQRDFNYVAHQRGRRTACVFNANGVLAGASSKTLRGTIELAHGCKGSEGSEQETVLLADERVENRTVPVILCDEDDVAGNHGATIGHVRPEQLFYLASRGVSPDAAERLFVTATFEEAALSAEDDRTRAAVARLAAARGIVFEEATA